MATVKSLGVALAVGVALGGGGMVAIDPGSDMTVTELVAANSDSLTQRVTAVIEPNSDTSIVKTMDADGKVISERKISGEHTSIRAEDILRVSSIPEGATLRLVAFVDNTVTAEWSTVSTDSMTSAMAQVVVYRR